MYTIKLIGRICNKLITYKFITNKLITKIEVECQRLSVNALSFWGERQGLRQKRTIAVWVKGVGRGCSGVVDAPGTDKSKGAEPKYKFDAAPKLKTL